MIVKPSDSTAVVPEEVVMQPRLTVGILVLQAEGLVSIIRYSSFLFQTTPAGVVAEPQQITVLIGHLSKDADLVAVEVVGLLAVFAVFVDVVLIGETACVPHTLRRDWRFHVGYGLLRSLIYANLRFL